MLFKMRSFTKDESGQTLTEYGLLLALIALAVIGTLVLLGPRLNSIFQTILNSLPGGGS
ncbi:MAG: Flp family type IVb pilin [Bacillota bacterium]